MKRTAIVRPIAHIALATAATVTALSASAAGMTHLVITKKQSPLGMPRVVPMTSSPKL